MMLLCPKNTAHYLGESLHSIQSSACLCSSSYFVIKRRRRSSLPWTPMSVLIHQADSKVVVFKKTDLEGFRVLTLNY